MCKYTIYHLDCGHLAEDHVDTSNCLHFHKTQVPCDRDNPANRGRFTVSSESRKGSCTKCLRQQRDNEELAAMQRELEKAKALSLAEAKERQRAAELHEKKIERDSIAEWARMQREKEQQEKEKREKEQRDLEAALDASREEEERNRQKELQELERALRDSRRVSLEARNLDVKNATNNTMRSDSDEERPVKSAEETTGVKQHSSSSVPPPPPMPTASAKRPAPTAIPSSSPFQQTETTVPSRAAPSEQPKLKATDYSLPAYGDQNYDRFMVGGRRQPVHESQKLKEPTSPKAPVVSTAPSPFGRLGSTIKPADIPSFSHMKDGVMQGSAIGARVGLRKSSGPRPSPPPPVDVTADSELQAKLLKRRQWEADDDSVSAGSVTPLGSTSDASSRPGTPMASRSSIERTRSESLSAPGACASVTTDAESGTATVLLASALDEKRRTGWR